MINITLIGQDIFLGSEIEKGMLKPLAKLYEVSEDEIIVSAHDSFIYHDGVEQTSYHLLVRVEAPSMYSVFEKLIAKYLLKYLKLYAIHIRIYFIYFSSDHYYEEINDEYPLFLKENNIIEAQDSSFEEEDEEIYHGNIFEEFDKALKESGTYNEDDKYNINESIEEDECHGECCHHHHHK